MEGHLQETLALSSLGATRSREWLRRVISLLEEAVGQLHNQEHAAQGTLLEATSLVRQQIDPPATREAPNGRGRLLAWQARKVRDYIDRHITGPVLVADLCALIQRSEAHFARSFKRTFGESPHCFVVRRRLELAAQYMLTTDASLSDIALRCGLPIRRLCVSTSDRQRDVRPRPGDARTVRKMTVAELALWGAFWKNECRLGRLLHE